MVNKLFVGGLAGSVTNEQLEELFKTVGNVISAKIIMDRATGESKGFGFVEMSSVPEAEKALSLTGTDLGGKAISVKEARPQESR